MKIETKSLKIKMLFCIFVFSLLLGSCNSQVPVNTVSVDESEKGTDETIIVSVDGESVYFTQEELRTQADLIFAGEVLDISPTRWNQDSGEYWTETTEEGVTADGQKLTTTHSAWPIYEIRMSVAQPIIDQLGVGQEVVLILQGKSPVDDAVLNSSGENVQVEAESISLQKGQELIVFVKQEEFAWRDPTRPIQLITGDGYSYFDIGNRLIMTLMGVYDNAYLVKGDDDLYYPAPDALDKQEPISLEQLAQEIAQAREGLAPP